MLIAALIALTALAQPSPADRSRPVVAELCNDTPARVAFAVARPSAGAGQVQRGWFTVEPGQCLEGAIGNGRGGLAHVHAFSGSYRWPASGPTAPYCTPARTHDRAVQGTNCSDDERALQYSPVPMASQSTHHTLTYRVGCEDLNAEDAMLCALGLQAQDGFAELVRELEVCNMSGADDRLAIAAPDPSGSSWQISEWVDLPSGACEFVWRGVVPQRTLFITSEEGLPVGERGPSEQSFCYAVEHAGSQTVSGPASDSCASDDQVLTAFGEVRFSLRSSRFTVMMSR